MTDENYLKKLVDMQTQIKELVPDSLKENVERRMPRLINADALMEAFAVAVERSNNSDFARVPTWNDAVSLVEWMPTVDAEPKWIPCSERLPNHDEYIKNDGLFNVSDGDRSYSEWFDIHDKQMFGEPTISGFRVDYAVIAWMPLPETYEVEE